MSEGSDSKVPMKTRFAGFLEDGYLSAKICRSSDPAAIASLRGLFVKRR